MKKEPYAGLAHGHCQASGTGVLPSTCSDDPSDVWVGRPEPVTLCGAHRAYALAETLAKLPSDLPATEH